MLLHIKYGKEIKLLGKHSLLKLFMVLNVLEKDDNEAFYVKEES